MNKVSLIAAVSSVFVAGCTGIPSGVRVVDTFDSQRYLGTWHEIARLDHRFERGLTQVSATYTARDDGGVAVNNRGYDPKSNRWKSIEGRAYFMEGADKGRLKVTFFWPFYGAYNVIALDGEAYSYAMVCGPSRDYLWILAREKVLPASVLCGLTSEAMRLGFATNNLIYVPQDAALNSQIKSNTTTNNER